MLNKCICSLTCLVFLLPLQSTSQEIKIFTSADFDVNGPVKSVSVITTYGSEDYHFNRNGLLTKAVTRFNDNDYISTRYQYKNQNLVEKRVENYRDNDFDKSTSMVNIYAIDTTDNRKITEKIVAYTGALLEQNVYLYDNKNQLQQIRKTDTDGTDIIDISYDSVDKKSRFLEVLNGERKKMVLTETLKPNADSIQKKIATTFYFDGELHRKTVESYNANQQLIANEETMYDVSTKQWIPQQTLIYQYDSKGILSEVKTKRRNSESSVSYIYQFDGTDYNNWVKEIIAPDNTYKTRKITYYPTEVSSSSDLEPSGKNR